MNIFNIFFIIRASMKKYISEMIGTMVLVLMGYGSAIFNGGCGTTA